MTGGVGFSSNASSRISANRNALNSKKQPYKKSEAGRKLEHEELNFIKPNEEELAKIKIKIQTSAKKTRRNQLIILTMAVIAFTSLIYFFFN